MQFWMYHRVSRITGYISGEVYKTNIGTIINHFLLSKILHYQEVLKNRFTQFGMKNEPNSSIASITKYTEYCSENITAQICGFLVKQEFSHLGDCFMFMSQKSCI